MMKNVQKLPARSCSSSPPHTAVTTNGPSPGAAASAEGAAPEEAPTEAPWPFVVRLTLGFVFLRFSVLLGGVSLLRGFERFTAAYQRSASSSNVTIIATPSLSNEVVLFPFKIHLGNFHGFMKRS